LILVALALVFFGDLVRHPTQVLYSDYSDMLAEHLPARRFLVRSWHETGEWPLWCPHSFGGAPFLHDPQVGTFYPPQWLLLLLPEALVGAGMSWLLVLHVMVAGLGMYAYARFRGLGPWAALVAAIGFMFAGKWMLHLLVAGHYIMAGLAWMPFVLIGLERAIQERSFWHATWAGVAFGLLVLGTHPQWPLYSGLFIAFWTLGSVLLGGSGPGAGRADRGISGRPSASRVTALCWWAGSGAWTALVGAALSAVQMVPTMEAAGLSTRASGVGTEEILAGGVRTLLFFVGPNLREKPSLLIWEDRGGASLLWLAAAVLAPLLCRGRTRFEAGVCLGLLLFALGGAMLVQPLPGFRVFRQPARMLIVATLPMAYLAGVATEALFCQAKVRSETSRLARAVLTRLTVATALLVGGFAVRMMIEGIPLRREIYWASLPVTMPLAFWLVGPRNRMAPRHAVALWAGLLLADLWAFGLPLVDVRPEAEVYPISGCLEALPLGAPGQARVLDRDAPQLAAGTPLGAGAPLAMVTGLEPLRGYNPLDVRRYKEYLQFIAGQEKELYPLESTFTYPVIGNFPIVHKQLLDLLGTAYLVQPEAMPVEGGSWRCVFEDAAPRGFDFISGGTRRLPPYVVYENPDAFPRAFVVPEAAPLPSPPDVLEALTQTDFRRRVLLEGWDGTTGEPGYAAAEQRARVREYRPNRVTVEVETAAPGFLVLTDAWYPGWHCTVDGQPAPLYRANYLFRATPVPEGRHEVVFTFAPDSYRTGRCITSIAIGVVVGIGLLTGLGGLATARSRGRGRS
jgi:hypothetical protein